MWILSIQKQGNASICLLKDGVVVLYLSEERVSRKKRTPHPFKSIQKIKQYTSKVDVVIFTGYDFNQEQNRLFYNNLVNEGIVDASSGWVEYPHTHHLFHASNAFYNSGFDNALCLVWDGRGSKYNFTSGNVGYETLTAFNASYPREFQSVYKHIMVENRHFDSSSDCQYDNSTHMSSLKLNGCDELNSCEVKFKYDLDLGCMYSLVTSFIGFNEEDCGKTMGLAAYGTEDSSIPPLMFGEYSNMNLFMTPYRINANLYPNLDHKNLAFSLQKTVEERGLEIVQYLLKKTGHKNLVIGGGVGLNVCLNYYLRKNLPSDINIYVEPNCEDSGNSIGAAKLYWHTHSQDNTIRPLVSCYSGEIPEYDYSLLENEEQINATYSDVVDLLIGGNIVSLFQGMSEMGPRALGNRSILFDPRIPNGKEIVNTVKNREWFRPFAASVLKEEAHNWFDLAGLEESPFMMFAVEAKPGVKEKIPSVIHVDNTCRIQTVTENQNLHYYNLIKEFYKKTGVPLLFNTSFNLAGDPMVETVGDALNTLRKSQIQYLYLPEIGKIIKSYK